jgi:outer membrane protein
MNLKLKKYISIALILLTTTGLWAQKVLTLDECLKLAMENNIELKRVKNNHLIAKANAFQAWMNFVPAFDASINYDFFKGNFFDTNAAKQVSAVTNSSNPRLRTSVTLFNGLSNQYNLKASKNNLKSAENGIEEQKQTVRTSVLTNYLLVVLDKENIKISTATVKLLEQQLDREVKRESVGVGNMEQVFNFKSNLANENLNLINNKNSLRRNKLALLQSLRLDPTQPVTIAPFELVNNELLIELEPFNSVLNQILSTSPSLKRAQLSSASSSFAFKSARGQMMPTITAFGQVGSNYSSNGALNPESGSFESGASFSDQMGFNQFRYMNLQLSIPIFNNWRNRNSMQVSKLAMYNADLDLEQTKLSITNTVERVYSDLVSAQETYKAAQENLSAINQSFEFAQTRYEAGSTDFYTYRESLNNKNRAELELVNAKYGIVFRKKILDVFKGTY